ncbi:MAG: isochorismatase family cysteine hydrolase [Spirochaetia bacterium]|jgi:nicotinamidase-related amidase
MAEKTTDAFAMDLHSAAFIIVDMQNDFVRVGAPLEVPDTRATIEPIKAVTTLFRAAHRPVIYTRFITGEQETLLWTWSPQIRPPVCCCRLGFRRRYDDIKAERECMAVIDELTVEPGDRVIDKYWYGAFYRTNLQDVLWAEGADTVVIAGTVTQICVEDTARGAFQLGFKTVVLNDCVSSFAPDLHAAALKNHAMKFGMVMSSGELERKFEQQGKRR